jgi:hypothetical protein
VALVVNSKASEVNSRVGASSSKASEVSKDGDYVYQRTYR